MRRLSTRFDCAQASWCIRRSVVMWNGSAAACNSTCAAPSSTAVRRRRACGRGTARSWRRCRRTCRFCSCAASSSQWSSSGTNSIQSWNRVLDPVIRVQYIRIYIYIVQLYYICTNKKERLVQGIPLVPSGALGGELRPRAVRAALPVRILLALELLALARVSRAVPLLGRWRSRARRAHRMDDSTTPRARRLCCCAASIRTQLQVDYIYDSEFE